MAPGSREERGRDGCMVLRACRNDHVSILGMCGGLRGRAWYACVDSSTATAPTMK